jgi:hypothetical protein
VVTQNFYDALKNQAQKAVCSYLDSAEKASSWLGDKTGIYLSDPSQYWKPVLCDEDPASASNPLPGPPFTGGQCEDRRYQVDFDFSVDGGPVFSNATQRFGPIGGPATETRESDNATLVGITAKKTVGGPVEFIQLLTVPDGDEYTFSITSVAPTDGLPDNCGDPSPIIPPFPTTGDPLPTQPPTTYDDPSGSPITIAPEFTVFAPIVIGPNVFAPVRVDLPDVSFDGTLTLAPEFNLELNPPSFDGSPGDSPEPTNPEDPTTSPDTLDDDKNQRLLGAFVRSQETGYNRQTQIDQDDSPTLIVARLGRLYFRVRMGGRLGWIGGYDVQSTNQYFPVPPGVYAVRAQAEWEGGWAGEVIPVFGLPDSTAL